MDWLTESKIPIGAWSKVIFDWMKANLGPLPAFVPESRFHRVTSSVSIHLLIPTTRRGG